MLDLIRKMISMQPPNALRLRLMRWMWGSVVREFPFGVGALGLRRSRFSPVFAPCAARSGSRSPAQWRSPR